MSAATLDKAPAAVAPVEVEAQPQRWAVLTNQAFHRLCGMLYETQIANGHHSESEAGTMLDDAESTLYYASHVSLTDDLLFEGHETFHCVGLLRAVRAQLLLSAQAYDSGQQELNDLEAFVLPNVTALVDELIAALTEVASGDHPLARLEAFATFRPALAAREPVRPQVLAEDEAEGMRDLAFDANHEISMLAQGMKRLLNIDRTPDDAMYFGMLSRIEHLCNIIFYAAKLYPGDPSEWDDHDLKTLRQKFEGITL